jgi:hypothetical protein
VRISPALPSASALAALVAVVVVSACDEPCCRSGVDCVDGAVCFEGRCALRCIADDGCDDGAGCVDGHCDPDAHGDETCAWGTTPLPADDAEVQR